jgi:hypothetical protein
LYKNTYDLVETIESTVEETLKGKINGFHLLGLAGFAGISCKQIMEENLDIESIFAWDKSNSNFKFLLRIDNGTIFGDDFTIVTGSSYFVNIRNREDIFPPIAGNYGIVVPSQFKDGKQWIAWDSATDDFTNSNELKYKVF